MENFLIGILILSIFNFMIIVSYFGYFVYIFNHFHLEQHNKFLKNEIDKYEDRLKDLKDHLYFCKNRVEELSFEIKVKEKSKKVGKK